MTDFHNLPDKLEPFTLRLLNFCHFPLIQKAECTENQNLDGSRVRD